MANKNTKLGGTDWTSGESVYGTDLNNTFDAVATTMGVYKYGTSTYTDNDTSQTFTEAFCSTTAMVMIKITSGTTAQGVWTVDSASGSFTITSTASESNDIPFNYFIVKNFI